MTRYLFRGGPYDSKWLDVARPGDVVIALEPGKVEALRLDGAEPEDLDFRPIKRITYQAQHVDGQIEYWTADFRDLHLRSIRPLDVRVAALEHEIQELRAAMQTLRQQAILWMPDQ